MSRPDNTFRCTGSNVEFKLTHHFTFFSPQSSCHLIAAFEITKLEISFKIDLDQTVRIRYNNLDCKVFLEFALIIWTAKCC